jgi:ATP-dependent metalloprotease FtsH
MQPGRNDSPTGRIVRSVLVWMGIFLSIVVMYVLLHSGQRPEWTVRYTDYLSFLDENLIASATITKSNLNDYEFHGELKQPVSMMIDGRMRQVKYFVTRLGTIDSRTEELWRSKGITWTYEQSDSSWLGTLLTVLMWVGLLGIFLLMMRRMQAGNSTRTIFSFGKARTRTLSDTGKRVTFMDVAGAEEAKFELQEIVEFLREPQKFQRLGGKIPKGVLLLGPPGTGKCVVGETLVPTNKGIIAIQDIPKHYWVEPLTGQIAGAAVPSFDRDRTAIAMHPVSHWYYLGRQRTIRITLRQGMSLEGTPEHPVLVMDTSGKLVYRRLDDLQPGDWVAVKFNMQTFGYRRDVDVEQAYTMGLLTGDGNLTISNRVELTSADAEIVEHFTSFVRQRYGTDVHIGRRQYSSVVSSWQIKKDFLQNGMAMLTAPHKAIPDTILQAPKEIVVAFLQGLFDADGYFQRYAVGYSTVSRHLAEQVTMLLLDLGIVPRLRVKTEAGDTHPHRVWEIVISGTSLPRFATEVGFRLPRKQQALEEYLATHTAGVNTNVDVIPHVAPLILECWKELRQRGKSTSRLASLADKLRDRGRVSRQALREFAEAFATAGCTHPASEYLAQLADLDVFFSPVWHIEHGEADVYDVTVPTTHSFVTNGMISHNTLLARAVAGEANVPFFSISGADFVEMFVGVGASRVRDLFDQAKRNAPCIVFIDEIDAVGRQRGAGLGGGHDEREQTLNALLVEMDGFEQNSGVIVIAATNRADILDPALLRPGRFDRHIVVDRPDVRGREGILKVHTRNIPLAPDVDLSVIARSTPGASGADLANIVNEAALFAARRGSNVVTMADFEQAKDKVFMGIERRSLVLSEREKRTTAYHEMGHALLGKLLPNADPVHKVTIIPRGPALGVTSYLPQEDRHTLSKDYIETQIMCLLGGRLAEKIVFNQYTTGAANDLERATALARKMVTEWGMSDRIGPVNYNSPHNEVFLGRDFGHVRPYSEQTAQLIDAEVTRIVRELEHRAEELLRAREDLMHFLVAHLLEKETLDGAELDRLIEQFEREQSQSARQENIAV